MTPIILLHGALGAASDLAPLASALRKDFDVHTLDFPGHGTAAMPGRPFDLRYFSEEVLRFMGDAGIARANIFGYSMGGCVGMLAAQSSPGHIAAVATFGTKYLWDAPTAEGEVRKLYPDKIEEKIPAFAKSLASAHGQERWKDVVDRTRAMIGGLGAAPPFPNPEDFAPIAQPCLVMVGDSDAMVSVEEARRVQQELPAAQLAVLPGTPHPLAKVEVEMLAFHLRKFFGGVGV